MAAHVRTILNSQETLEDLENSKQAKATAKAQKIAHSALTGSLLRTDGLLVLLPLNAPSGPENFKDFLEHLHCLGQNLDPRASPPKKKVIAARSFLRKHAEHMLPFFTSTVALVFKRLAHGQQHLASEVIALANKLTPAQKRSWPADLILQIRDASNAVFLIDYHRLSQFNYSILEFAHQLQLFGRKTLAFSETLPRMLCRLSVEKRICSFLPAMDRMTEKPVYMTYAERDAPLALAPQRRVITESTDLGELFWKSLKRFESERKRSKSTFAWGKLLNGFVSTKRFDFPFSLQR